MLFIYGHDTYSLSSQEVVALLVNIMSGQSSVNNFDNFLFQFG